MSHGSTPRCPRQPPTAVTGRVPAGCVFWIKGAEATFSTVAEDHGNCSVGSLTHGFKTLDEVAGNSDVAELIGAGWVTLDVVPQIPVVSERPGAITYGPLAATPVDPDVVLIRVTGKQLMVLHDAVPDMHLEGKPQCHIVAMAKETGQVAASVGCALSRVRTGMPAREMTCAIPGAKLARGARRADHDEGGGRRRRALRTRGRAPLRLSEGHPPPPVGTLNRTPCGSRSDAAGRVGSGRELLPTSSLTRSRG